MCVIVHCKKIRIPEHVVDDCYEKNKDGIGVAWAKDSKVYFKKGLSLEDLKILIKTLPLPYVVHFRKTTIGGNGDHLNHPFPIDHNASLDIEGEAINGVLFHNGTVKEWKFDLKSLIFCIPEAIIPDGEWSDSRAMAYIVSYKGGGVCNLYTDSNRFLIYHPINGIEKYGNWNLLPSYYIHSTEKPDKKILELDKDYEKGISFSKDFLK